MSAYSSGAAIAQDIRVGNVYLIEERRPKVSFDTYEHLLGAGFEGMIATREPPARLMAERGLDSCKIVWLTNLVGDGRINPTAIGILMSQIRAFIETHKRTVIMLDGLEYLITLNTYDRMLQFMNQLRDIVMTNESVLLVPLDPRTVSERELALLERNVEPVIPKGESDVAEEPLIHTEAGEIRLYNASSR